MYRDKKGRMFHSKLGMLKFHSFLWVKRIVGGITLLGLLAGYGYGSFITGAKTTLPVTVYAEKTVEKIVTDNSIPPILQTIMNCESTGTVKGPATHYDKNGQVLINATEDIGIMQINVPIWGKKAHDMGLNLAVEKDNIEFGVWLFRNFGSEPWSASKKKCWSK